MNATTTISLASPYTAEALLQKLQQSLRETTVQAASERAVLRETERAYGAQATRYGRLLSDILTGSYAWDLLEAPQVRGRRLPRIHELCTCEPVLQAMRESGELQEREALLKQRDATLAAVWREAGVTDQERWQEAEAVQDDYFCHVQQIAEAYRAHYETLQRAATEANPLLAAPRIRSRLLLQPPLMALLFRACHQEEQGGNEFREGRTALQLLSAESEGMCLDPMLWDLAALAVSAFYVRTDGTRTDTSFTLHVDDYFQWRGVDPRKRSRALREQVAARLALLCSERLHVRNEVTLWRTDPKTGRRRKTAVSTEGPFLVKRSRLFRPSRVPGEEDPETTGYLLSLGEWAAPFVAERAMLGIHLKRLAEYDLQRQQWERRIGWYLVFQMNNQASKMTFQDTPKDGKTRTVVTPQHPLKMRTVLDHSQVAWEETARTNPGKVIKQWCDALDTLRKDGILGPSPCLDGPADGSDLPVRGRLTAMLERRYQFVPGRDLLPHLRAKRGSAARKQ